MQELFVLGLSIMANTWRVFNECVFLGYGLITWIIAFMLVGFLLSALVPRADG